MRTNSGTAIRILIKHAMALIGICTVTALGSAAQAVTITFDDIEYIPGDCFCDNPLTDQYAPRGLLIGDGFLAQYPSDAENAVSPPQYLMGGNVLQLSFVGALPTFVGMYVSSFFGEAIYLNAFDALGQVTEAKTSGWAGPDDDSPYQPNQYISFSSPLGFTSISIEGFYNMRVSAAVDNLTFEYAAVPEPSSLFLLGVGLLGFGGLRLRLRMKGE
ncbi:MAG: PEP-CTERM sorting domain-containing protein [Pseudomonadota bacterium]